MKLITELNWVTVVCSYLLSERSFFKNSSTWVNIKVDSTRPSKIVKELNIINEKMLVDSVNTLELHVCKYSLKCEDCYSSDKRKDDYSKSCQQIMKNVSESYNEINTEVTEYEYYLDLTQIPEAPQFLELNLVPKELQKWGQWGLGWLLDQLVKTVLGS